MAGLNATITSLAGSMRGIDLDAVTNILERFFVGKWLIIALLFIFVLNIVPALRKLFRILNHDGDNRDSGHDSD